MTDLPLDRLARARLYLCTDARRERGDLAEFADAALAGGVDIIQLRDKGSVGEQRFGPLEAREELAALAVLADAAQRHGALFAVNDRADVAVRRAPMCCTSARMTCRCWWPAISSAPEPVIGRSTHDIDQVRSAVGEDPELLDYFCVGPCWPTPTKPGRTAPGLDLVRATAALAPAKPWFAIGGIDEQRLPEVLDAGATRVVVVRAIAGGRRSAGGG